VPHGGHVRHASPSLRRCVAWSPPIVSRPASQDTAPLYTFANPPSVPGISEVSAFPRASAWLVAMASPSHSRSLWGLITRWLHISWLFPMTSEQAASWVLAFGTILAIAATGITFNWQNRQQQRERLRRESEQQEAQARLVQAWISERRRITYGTLNHVSSFLAITAQIKNLGDLVAHDIRLSLRTFQSHHIVSAWRMMDVLPPAKDPLQVTWLFDDANPDVLNDDVVLISRYTVASQTWEQCKGRVIPITASPPPLWQRLISQAWLTSVSDLTNQQFQDQLTRVICAAIDEASISPPRPGTDHYVERLSQSPVPVNVAKQLADELNDRQENFNFVIPSARDVRLARIEILLQEFWQLCKLPEPVRSQNTRFFRTQGPGSAHA
jgi:hypothetical protein